MVDENNTHNENDNFENFENGNFENNNFEGGHDDHFMEEDDFLAADRGVPDDLDAPPPKPSLKEIWQQNPSIKIFAVIAFVAVMLISYLVFGSSNDDKKEENESVVGQGSDVSQPPGTQELPPAYEQAVRDASADRASQATQTGGSAIPTPIARPSERIEAPVQVEQSDPLSEWRREAEERRVDREKVDAPNTTATNVPLLPTSNSEPSGNNLGTGQLAQQQPQNPPLPTGPSPEQVNAMSQQLQAQMQTIMETQVPKESVVVSMNITPQYDPKKYFGDPSASNNTTTPAAASNGSATSVLNPGQPPQKPLVQAGTIVYAQVITQANSDVPGPVLAEVASGPLLGGRAIGQFSVAQRELVLQFNRIIKDGIEYQVEAFALDPATTLPAVVTDIDRHYFSRIVLPAAARFIEGYADAATQRDTSVVVTNGAVVTNSNNNLDTKQELLNGANEGAQQLSSVLQQDFGNRPVTIKVAAGTRIGLLFTASVYDPSAMPQGGQQNQNQNPYQNAAGSYLNQGLNAYNAYNNYANGGSNNYNNGNNVQQQYYQQQQYQQQQQQQYVPTPSLRSGSLR
jgi:intracellular multiplication protein IcmE